MLSLTGKPLLVLTIVLAVLAVAALAWLVYRTAGRPPMRRRHRAFLVAGTVVLAVLAPVFAVGATALAVNNDYGFYTSWADLLGSGPGQVSIASGTVLPPGQGSLRVDTLQFARPRVATSSLATSPAGISALANSPLGSSAVGSATPGTSALGTSSVGFSRARATGVDRRVVVWLPPGYDAHAARPYPVVMFLPGQPGSPESTIRHFEFARIATHLVQSGQMAPFVGVFPTLMIAPPRDTECTNIPGGPQAETWLNNDVPAYVSQHYRVQAPGPKWSLVGWSTGGFCAAKLVAAHPGRFGSATSFGGYFTPLQDHTTGDLFGGQAQAYDHNSPLWLYQHHHGLGTSRLLVVAGRQDRETWTASEVMLQAAGSDPAVSHLVFPTGGHNYRNYRSYLAQALVWGARYWGP